VFEPGLSVQISLSGSIVIFPWKEHWKSGPVRDGSYFHRVAGIHEIVKIARFGRPPAGQIHWPQ
jgi:hypothetical protein